MLVLATSALLLSSSLVSANGGAKIHNLTPQQVEFLRERVGSSGPARSKATPHPIFWMIGSESSSPVNWQPQQPQSFPAHFDGTLVGEVENSSEFMLLGTLQTVMAWVNPDERLHDWARLVGKGDYHVRNYGLWLAASGSTLYQFNAPPNQWANLEGPEVPLREWTHLAGVLNGNHQELYINGELASSQDVAIRPNKSKLNVLLGYGNAHTHFQGKLDGVMIFDQPLNQQEIQQLMVITRIPSAVGDIADAVGDAINVIPKNGH